MRRPAQAGVPGPRARRGVAQGQRGRMIPPRPAGLGGGPAMPRGPGGPDPPMALGRGVQPRPAPLGGGPVPTCSPGMEFSPAAPFLLVPEVL